MKININEEKTMLTGKRDRYMLKPVFQICKIFKV